MAPLQAIFTTKIKKFLNFGSDKKTPFLTLKTRKKTPFLTTRLS